MLILTADGRFTTSALPAAGVGDWRIGSTPVSGSGVRHVGVSDSSTQLGVIFDFANGSQAELQLEQDGSTLALFYDGSSKLTGIGFLLYYCACSPGGCGA